MGANKEAYEPVRIGGEDYETVAASQTAQVLGTAGSVGDFISRLIISVTAGATATVTLLDNATSIPILVGGATVVPGVYSVEIGARSVSGAWKITTGAGATVLAVGKFSV
jgi:hypothetical protein